MWSTSNWSAASLRFLTRNVLFMISKFHHVLNVVCFLLDNFLASEFYIAMFYNTLSVLSFEDETDRIFIPTHL
jgi:hypothetical protein